ncbi:MAG: NAD-dependent epimerase/dehydratase family protein, partial [Candidatus Subteraquimicrobiales bacterium]|nr:NAD-dependent epimerase/dehydratase family protein [Candidatus Subteraquimicrobiales bacterium]
EETRFKINKLMAKLITGGLGFIGTYLARALLKKSEEVVLFDVATKSSLLHDIKDKVKIIQGDLASWAEVLEVVKDHNIDGIYHTGALLSASAEEKPITAYHVNAGGTFNILEAARLFNVERVIYLSTIATYGPGIPETVNEDTIQMPISMYGVTKVFSERLGEYYFRKFGVDFRGLRFPSVIGPGRGPGGVSAYSTLIIQDPALGRPYQCFVDEEARIPLLYIKDAVDSLIALYEADNQKLKRRVYNIAGFSPTAREVAQEVRKYLPKAIIEFKPAPEMVEVVHSWPKYVDEKKAHEEWSWKTKYFLKETVEDFIKEVQAHREIYG